MRHVLGALACVGFVLVSPNSVRALEIGDPAPPLKIQEWVKGQAVDLEGLRGKKVVVLEFWATWCGPCRASIPHLSKLQRKYDGALVVIGATSKDPRNSLDTVRDFVSSQGKKMAYTVAFDDGNATTNAYMRAMDARGIPTAFVIDLDGRLAWMGHPASGLDEIVEQAIEGKLDLALIKKVSKVKRKINLAIDLEDWSGAIEALDDYLVLADVSEEEMEGLDWQRFECLAKNRRTRKQARTYGQQLVAEAGNSDLLNQYAWEMLTNDDYRGKYAELAHAAAKKANKLSGGKDSGILDTLARAKFAKGNLKAAIRLQKAALKYAAADERQLYEGALDEYQAAKNEEQ
ncbi:MAG: TlpA family protein disulfide reductase [Planctomycetes bacterium]|nr:TlpA family protein disulfide reductase [Planctomycetota bacterium]